MAAAFGVKQKPLLLPRIILPLQHAHGDSTAQLPPGIAGRRSPTAPYTPQPQSSPLPQLFATGTSGDSSTQTLLTLPQQTQTNGAGHKRSISSGDEDDDDESAWSPERKRKKASSRKPTYLVRKEEKDLLLAQVRQLQAHVDFLRERCGVVNWQSKDKQLQQRTIENDMLRESVRNQQFSFFSAQSVVSELLMNSERCPIDTRIHLGTDWSKRRETLVALKAQKLHDAQRLLEKRMQFIDPMKELAEDTNFVSANGDFCSIAFQNVPLRSARGGVRQVYDTLQFHTQNMERSISEAMGTVLTSDGDDNWDKTILHRRLVHSTVRDVVVESNFAVFSEFYDSCRKGQWTNDRRSDRSGKELGVIVLDFVDQDELFPYRSRQCMRRDVTGVILLRSVPCKSAPGATSSSPSEPGSDHTVVITKWIMLRLRHNSALNVPDNKMRELRAGIHHISNALVRAVENSIAPSVVGNDAAIV